MSESNNEQINGRLFASPLALKCPSTPPVCHRKVEGLIVEGLIVQLKPEKYIF